MKQIRKVGLLSLLLIVTLATTLSCVVVPPEDEREPGIYIVYVVASPTSSERLSIINTYNYAVDISGWTIGDKNSPFEYTIPNPTILAPDEYVTFNASTMGFGINDDDEILYLYNGATLIDTWYN
jgi:hypothetical protein